MSTPARPRPFYGEKWAHLRLPADIERVMNEESDRYGEQTELTMCFLKSESQAAQWCRARYLPYRWVS
jgi:hypothetical protein